MSRFSLADAPCRAAAAGQVQLSPQASAYLVREVRAPETTGALNEREAEVLRLLAQGQSNKEALHNIVKHARANTVTLRLTRQENEIILQVRDDGKGFDPTALFAGHFGVRSMRERAAKMGGTLTIESAPGRGTCVEVRVPWV